MGPDKMTLLVKTIKDAGTIVTYNSASPPDAQLRPGDYIVKVNGVSGDKDKMLEEIKSSKTIVLTVQRGSTTPADQEVIANDTPGQSTEAEKVEPAPEQEPQEGTATETAGTNAECKTADKIAEASIVSEPGENVLVDGSVEVPIVEEAKNSSVVEPVEPEEPGEKAKTSTVVEPVEPEKPVEQEGNVDDKGCQVCKGWFA